MFILRKLSTVDVNTKLENTVKRPAIPGKQLERSTRSKKANFRTARPMESWCGSDIESGDRFSKFYRKREDIETSTRLWQSMGSSNDVTRNTFSVSLKHSATLIHFHFTFAAVYISVPTYLIYTWSPICGGYGTGSSCIRRPSTWWASSLWDPRHCVPPGKKQRAKLIFNRTVKAASSRWSEAQIRSLRTWKCSVAMPSFCFVAKDVWTGAYSTIQLDEFPFAYRQTKICFVQ